MCVLVSGILCDMKEGKKETIVIALGGSIIISQQIQTYFLKRFRAALLPLLEGRRFIIVAGGGTICRNYLKAASAILSLSDEDKDWLGIHSTRLNAQLLRTIFVDEAYPVVIDNPLRPIPKGDWNKFSLFFASGWKPGWSTDYVAVRLAQRFGASKMIIATKIPYVYTRDVAKHKNAKPIPDITWKKYRGLVDEKWSPGMKVPVDPIAARYAQHTHMNIVVVRGTNLKNLRNVILGKPFFGTVIHPDKK